MKMASIFISSQFIFFFLISTLLSPLCTLPPVAAFEFQVGDDDGWMVPPSDKTLFYNSWASKNRFQVDDTLNFKYKKDSVMEVTSEDYNHCNSSHPIFFSNKLPTIIKLDRSGPFYFISGVSGHCERGQKMIVKVLGHSQAPENSPSPPGGGGSKTPPGPTDSSAIMPKATVARLVIMQLFMLVVGFSFPWV